MKIIIKAKNIESSESLNRFIEEKFEGLQKFINVLKEESEIGKTLAEVFVEIEKDSNHHKKGDIFLVKSQIILPGRSLMVEKNGEDLFVAVVAARDEMKQEIEKYKFKNVEKRRREQRKAKQEIVK